MVVFGGSGWWGWLLFAGFLTALLAGPEQSAGPLAPLPHAPPRLVLDSLRRLLLARPQTDYNRVLLLCQISDQLWRSAPTPPPYMPARPWRWRGAWATATARAKP